MVGRDSLASVHIIIIIGIVAAVPGTPDFLVLATYIPANN